MSEKVTVKWLEITAYTVEVEELMRCAIFKRFDINIFCMCHYYPQPYSASDSLAAQWR